MTIWLLALLLLGASAGMGYTQGAIRVACSTIGIIVAALLASPLGKLIHPLLTMVGIKSPVLLWILGPLIIFILISILFKVGAGLLHHKIDVHYKYHAGDLRISLWERVNARLGLCLGLVNGTLYLILASIAIYSLSYWTYQVATTDAEPKTLTIMNRLGKDLEITGFNKVAHSVDGNSETFYDAADLAGLLYNNSLLEARLSRYPGLLGLSERPEFLDLAADTQFTQMRQSREPIMHVLNYPKVQEILKNSESLKAINSTLIPDLKDLRGFLETGRSAKYEGEKILGRWAFDVNSALAMLRRLRPNVLPTEMQKLKRGVAVAFGRTTFIAAPDHQAFFKNVPPLTVLAGGLAATAGSDNYNGEWKNTDGKYEINAAPNGKQAAYVGTIENDRLTLAAGGMSLVFNRED
jgi:uncharacterized membrane protein required for colicin V production